MIKQTFSGNENSISISQKRIIQYLIDYKASSYYLVHNHPSGNPFPSKADLTMTNNVELLALSLGFVLEDHLIFGLETYYSIKRKIEVPYLK
jgi:DNA repair protein RadC